MSRDESVYTDPESFNPDRYIATSNGGAGEPSPVGPFGFGRRYVPTVFASNNHHRSDLTSVFKNLPWATSSHSKRMDYDRAYVSDGFVFQIC